MATILDPNDEAAMNGSAQQSQNSASKRERRLDEPPSQAAARREFWTARAPKQLRRGKLDPDAAWDVWWNKRQAPASVARVVHAAGTPLIWGWNPAELTEESRALVDLANDLDHGADPRRFAKGKRGATLHESVDLWLETARDGDTNVSFALGCLAAAHVLNRLGQHLCPDSGWPLIDFLYATADDSRAWCADVDGGCGAILAQQLVAGELPLTLSYLFDDVAPAAALRRTGRKHLAAGLAAVAGEKGFVRASHLEVLRPLIACWSRSRAIGKQIDKGAWNRTAQQQLHSLVRQSLRWTDAGGRQPLVDGHVTCWTPDFLAAAIRFGGTKREAAAARSLFAGRSLAAEIPATKRKPAKPANLSESAKLAILRTNWSPTAGSIAIDYSGIGMRVAVAAEGRDLFAGVWTATSRIDGKLLKPTGAWDAVCWFTDKDVDYIEFRVDLEQGARLERQVLLARADQFLLLADHLQAQAPGSIEHGWQLPLADRMAFRGESETRDGVLVADDSGGEIARILPLALPEWRIDPRMGELTSVDGALRLAQRTAARAVACPIFIDLNPRRAAKPCTWRQLTVAEALEIQPPEVAVGYRVQCGPKQWMIYRSQAPRGNRTLLGQNTSNEFVVARFLAPAGEIKELIQVE